MAIFPKLEVKPPKQSHHNRSHFFRTSMAPGCLVPIYCRNVVPGDEINLDYESLVETQALLSPLYGSFKLQIDTFFAGTSLYVPQLWRNGSMKQADGTLHAPYPTFKVSMYSTTSQEKGMRVDPSSLLAYLGFNPGYAFLRVDSALSRSFNAIPLLMYLDIYRHYYANRQEASFPFIGNPTTPTSTPQVTWQSLAQLDDLFLNLGSNGFDVSSYLESLNLGSLLRPDAPLSGLLLKTYSPDRMNVILNSEFYGKNVSSVQVSTAGGNFQVDQLVTAKKLWNSRNKDAMSSGTFKDWVRLHYGVTPKIMDDMPTFCGSTSTDILFQDIRATTTSTVPDLDFTQFLGDKASSGSGFMRSRRHVVKADRPGYVMVLASIVPRVDYYQNLERYTMYTDISDEFRPEYNGIGLQDVLVSDLNADFSSIPGPLREDEGYADPAKDSVGKQPAWIEYMTAVNKIRGTFCSSEKSWVLARDMRANPSMTGKESQPVENTATTAYVIPGQWNQPFALQQLTDQNFLCQFKITDVVRSSVLKRLLPKF